MEALDGFQLDRSKLPKCLFRNGPGVPYRKSMKIGDTSTTSFAAWDSVVWGKEEDGFVKVGQCYLPMTLNQVPVLAPTSVSVTSDEIPVQDSNTLAFRVTRGTVEEVKEILSPVSQFSWRKQSSAPADGLSYRKSQNITDVDGHYIAPWDSLVFGTLTDGFLKIGHRYLPTHVDGECVLVQHDTPAIPDTSRKGNDSSPVQNEAKVETPEGVDVNCKESVATEEQLTTKESVATQNGVVTQENVANKENVATQLVETHVIDNTQLDGISVEDDAVVIQLTQTQQQLKAENQMLSKRLEVIGEGVWELTSGLSSLSFRFEKVKSDLENELSSIKQSNLNVCHNPNMRDTELESRLVSFESRLSNFNVERTSSAINTMEARLVEHAKRMASCEDQLSQLVNAKHVETPLPVDIEQLRQVQSEVVAERRERMLQFSELQSLKEQLMPRLEACEAELNKKVFGADLETELIRIKETVAVQLTKQQEEFSPHLSDVTKNMNKLASRFAEDLEFHLEKVGRDFEARLTTHVQDTDARLAIYRDILYKFAGNKSNDASTPKTNPPRFSSNSNVLGIDSFVATDDQPPNSVIAGGPQVQPVSIDGKSQDLYCDASLQDMGATFWASEAGSKALPVDEPPSSIREIHSVSSPQIRQNPTGDHLHSHVGRACASPAQQSVFRRGSSAGLMQGSLQSTPFSNPLRSSTPQPVSSRGTQSPLTGAIYVQSGTPRSVSPQLFSGGGRRPSMGAVYVRPGTTLS